MSCYTQELVCQVGQEYTFSHGEKVFDQFTKSEVHAKQIERVSHYWGQKLIEEDCNRIKKEELAEYSPEDADELYYVSVDGSMYFTREEGWKEIKLGRIFKASNLLRVSPSRREVKSSQYVTHLGGVKDFIPKMDYHIENLKNKVFIADGAIWIWNWIEDTYPECVQIVDYYHAREHLCEFANEVFKSDDNKRIQWIENVKQVLIEQGVDPIIEDLLSMEVSDTYIASKDKLLGYLQPNKKRMQYHKFIEDGLDIGSGAMEAAHRNVLQHRVKRSGQRWTINGIQQITTLRASLMSTNNGQRLHALIQKKAA